MRKNNFLVSVSDRRLPWVTEQEERRFAGQAARSGGQNGKVVHGDLRNRWVTTASVFRQDIVEFITSHIGRENRTELPSG